MGLRLRWLVGGGLRGQRLERESWLTPPRAAVDAVALVRGERLLAVGTVVSNRARYELSRGGVVIVLGSDRIHGHRRQYGADPVGNCDQDVTGPPAPGH